MTSLDRNALCPCQSGKKYKKCCLSTEKAKINPPFVTFASGEKIEVKYGPCSDIDTACNFPPLVDNDQETLDLLSTQIQRHPDKIPHYLEELSKLEQKNPNNPAVLQTALLAYSLLGKEEDLYALTSKMHEKFPHYLFAITAETLACLNKNDDEKAYTLLGQYSCLPEIYPHRKSFHMTEITTFAHARLQYACKKGQVEEAQKQLALLECFPSEITLLEDARNAFSRLKTFYKSASV